MCKGPETAKKQRWLWDVYPLADDAWPNVSLSKEDWGEWLRECGQTIVVRRFVTGPGGPSFLTEYTPADDYIIEGYSGQHATFNGLYQDEDRKFYVPQPHDLATLRRVYPGANPETPNWSLILATLCAEGQDADDLAKMKAPVLIALLGQLPGRSVSENPDQISSSKAQAEHCDQPAEDLSRDRSSELDVKSDTEGLSPRAVATGQGSQNDTRKANVPPKRSWTAPELDEAIREHVAKRSQRYQEFISILDDPKTPQRRKKIVRDEAQKMFGRNVIATALDVKSPKMVSQSRAWAGVAAILGLPLMRNQIGKPASRPQRIGMDIAVEKASMDADADHAPAADVKLMREEQEETLRQIRRFSESGLLNAATMAASLLESYTNGEMTDDQVRRTIKDLQTSI